MRRHEPSESPQNSHRPSVVFANTEPHEQRYHEQECEESSDKEVDEESSGEQDVEPPAPKLPLSPEQQRALNLAMEGHNLFITG